MSNNICSQFMKGFFDRMSDVIRYSGTKVLNKENLAEHTYYVGIIADGIAEDLEKKFDLDIDRYRVLKYALYHDIEEVFTGDIVSPVKYKSESLRKQFEEVGNLILEEELKNHFYGNTHISKMILSTHRAYEEGKRKILENKIVKLADILQAIGYTISERNLGNTHLIHITRSLVEILENRYGQDKYFSAYVVEVKRYLDQHKYV
ncbi:HD domain-containing protein [Candidatus Gracilibacteria bacterium]|nr:HD domain-containing protein [Candidatus Gracilibacteria bacterium]